MLRLFSLAERRAEQTGSASIEAAPIASKKPGRVAAQIADAGGNTYEKILKLGQSQFDLRIDGNNQTTGGNHQSGSFHYSGRAVDFGDAKNSTEKLRRFAAWARQNAQHIKEFYYNPLGWGIKNGKVIKGLSVKGHDDHVHIAI